MVERERWTRRRVLKTTASIALSAGIRAIAETTNPSRFVLMTERNDELLQSPSVIWAVKELHAAFRSHHLDLRQVDSWSQTGAADLCIVVGSPSQSAIKTVLQSSGVSIEAVPQALGIVRGQIQGVPVIAATGNDALGAVYALLELADAVTLSEDPVLAIKSRTSLVERPANRVRSITRLFTSDVEDKPWFNDREMWPHYLTMLAKHRFNRFNLAFGIGYDFIRQVTDSYLLFSYPFLLKVPGYEVRATSLSDSERESNLAMLRFIAKETVERGIEFFIGLWMHGYEWIDSPNANHVIEGITKENHGPYCRDALRLLLQKVPEISGVTLRIHGESGVTEGSYEFWQQVFEGASTCGRKVVIDMHTKGMDETMENLALATGMPVQMSPKYWGEHMGMPYHQSDIRVMEQPLPDAEKKTGLMKFSTGTRSFLRYGYGDLLREDRRWSVVHRIWPGSQRILIWGDPVWAAAYSRSFSFCGSDGVEIMEMLSFKGRRGSGIAGSRTAYADQSLVPRWDWQKYEYTTRVWGRCLYNPDTDREVFLRSLRCGFGPAAEDALEALSQASRILPTVLTAYAPSAGNNTYWPELYTNESYVDSATAGPYGDSPKPVVFSTASTFDPPMFSRMSEHAQELLDGEQSGKYSPLEVADWLDSYASAASSALNAIKRKAGKKQTPDYRRMVIDVTVLGDLGRFYAARLRSGVLFALYEKSNDRRALEESLVLYKSSRAIWAELSRLTDGVYMKDITVGEQLYQRGHWLDRLPAMDKDIAIVEQLTTQASTSSNPQLTRAIEAVQAKHVRRLKNVQHAPARSFHAGQPLRLNLQTEPAASVTLHYRHVNQAERYTVAPMINQRGIYELVVPSSYTNTEYPLQYYFQIQPKDGDAYLYPGFDDLRQQSPYFIVRNKANI